MQVRKNFFAVFEPFRARLFSKFEKCISMTCEQFFTKKLFWVLKNAEFDADLNP
jgi:hypothetical protein